MRRPGDIILVQGHGFIGNAVNWFEALLNRDHQAKHNHAAMIISEDKVLETGSNGGAFTGFTPWPDYAGHTIQVWRWAGMNDTCFVKGVKAISNCMGRIYPYWRLLILFPLGLAGLIHWKNKVCSEFIACFLRGAGAITDAEPVSQWFLHLGACHWGVDPDDLHDFFASSPEWELVYEGKGRDCE